MYKYVIASLQTFQENLSSNLVKRKEVVINRHSFLEFLFIKKLKFQIKHIKTKNYDCFETISYKKTMIVLKHSVIKKLPLGEITHYILLRFVKFKI